MKKLKKRLPCQLDDAEIAILADKLVDHMQKADLLKLRAKAAAASFKLDIDGQLSQAKDLGNQIHERTREQDVECGEIILEDSGDAVTLRLDTGEEVGRRRLSEEDRQGSLLTLVPPANEQEAADHDEEQRIRDLFALADTLKGAGMELGRNLRRLWTLQVEQITEARKWAMQKKSVGLSEEAPEAPEWLLQLQAESLKDVQAEKESEIRAQTLRAVLLEQGLKVEVEDIRAWTTPDQNTVLKWADSLLGETPLTRPEFLSKYDPQQPLPEESSASFDESATADSASEAPDAAATEATAATAPETTKVKKKSKAKSVAEPAASESGATDGALDAPDSVSAVELEDVDALSASNGHCPMSREDLALKIAEFGVNVDQVAVEEWSEDEADRAYEWIVETTNAINSSGERKPAPDFFFK